MERNGRLDAAGCACIVAALIGILVCGARGLGAQCAAASAQGSAADAQIRELFVQQNWAEAVRLAAPMKSRSANAQFEYGMALGHLNRLNEARAALMEGARQCPTQKRFPIELGGVAFEQKDYAAAAHWLRRGLRLDPRDDYANNFLGTVYFLFGNLDAALKYWNRVGKPRIAALDLDPHLRVHRLLLDRAFAFAPASELREPQLITTQTRLNAMGIFPSYNLHLDARPDGSFDAVFRAQEQNGFGSSRLAAALSTFGGAPYETLYPSYGNIGRSAMNFDALARFDPQKRRAWGELSAPLQGLPQWRWQVSTDLRNENWAIRRSFTGDAPVLGSLNLEREAVGATLTSLASGAWQWWAGGELSHRVFRNVLPGSALTSELVTPGWELKQLAGVQGRLVSLPEHRFTLTAGAASDFARTLNTAAYASEKLEGKAQAQWLPGMRGDNYELSERLRAGKIFGTAPFDDLFELGMERDDSDLWMRGHLATRDGRKGCSPVGDGYLLSNTGLLRRVYGNGLVEIHLGPLADVGKMSAPTSGLSAGTWLVDIGVEARLKVFHTSVILSYGRDLRSGANALFGAAGGSPDFHWTAPKIP